MFPLFLLLLAMVAVPLTEGTECTRSSDCPTSSPHCSKWGYCQWSPRYGQSGPERQRDRETKQNLPPTLRALTGETGTDDYDVYNYYAGFEARKRGQEQTEKSTRHKIDAQFSGTTSSSSSSARRPRPLEDDPASSSVSSQGCLTDCVNDCIAITQLTAYKDCVGFCGQTCTD